MITLDGSKYDGSNYFNGNYILSKTGNVEFLATQAPIENTVEEFWNVSMINGVSAIFGIN